MPAFFKRGCPVKRLLVVLLLLAALGAGAFWYLTSPGRQTAGLEPVPAGEPNVANGETIFYAGGCTSCHAVPEQPDKLRLGGGYPLRSPFGTFHVPNISPHPRDGIGSWTVEQFVRAMQAGISPDGRHYYPSFPYPAYQRMNAADLRDLFAFIKTLQPVEGRIRDHDLPFPYSFRRGIGLWKLAFLDGEPFRPDPAKSASLNRGAYLVEGAGHCAECHSPRNVLGAIEAERRYAGGPNPEGRSEVVPNITPHPSGLDGWTRSDVAELLGSGMTPEGDFVGSTMAAVVANTGKLGDEDRTAMAEYILSLPPREKWKAGN
jgi:mono/diheme cytochrome c family protein